ncbi:MAG TPA: tetratricopeptide repeat protein, partial [Candidatus Polarisedimenticolaceae bacterium]|nr:tetratricopeptide repeat protein [Candidatus Polarisedimenticolaceae bacterium]
MTVLRLLLAALAEQTASFGVALLPSPERERLAQRYGLDAPRCSFSLGLLESFGGTAAFIVNGLAYMRPAATEQSMFLLRNWWSGLNTNDFRAVGLVNWLAWFLHPLAWALAYFALTGLVRCVAFAITREAVGEPLVVGGLRAGQALARRYRARRLAQRLGPARPDRVIGDGEEELELWSARPKHEWELGVTVELEAGRFYRILAIEERAEEPWSWIAYRLQLEPPGALVRRVARYEASVKSVCAALVLAGLASISALRAQDVQWNELNARVAQLLAQGDFAGARSLAQEALRAAEAAFAPEDARIATAADTLAQLDYASQDYAAAEPLFQRALAIRERALGPNDAAVAMTINNLAELYRAQGRAAAAEPLFQRSLAILEASFGKDDPRVATGLSNLAELYQGANRLAEAEPLLQRSLAIREAKLGADAPLVGANLASLGELYAAERRFGEAEPMLKRSLAIAERAFGADQLGVAAALDALARLYDAESKFAEAEPLFARSLAIVERAGGPDHPAVAVALNNLAALYLDQGKFADGQPLLERAISIYEKAYGPDSPYVAMSLTNLANHYRAQGRFAEAEPRYRRALAILERALPPDSPDIAGVLNALGQLCFREKKLEEAASLLERAVGIHERVAGADDVNVAFDLEVLAMVSANRGEFAAGAAQLGRALTICEKALGPEHLEVARVLNDLAFVELVQGKYSRAEAHFSRAHTIAERLLGPDHPDVATIVNSLALLHDAQGKVAEAEALFERGLASLSAQFERGFTYMSERDRLQFLDVARIHFDVYFSFCLRHGNRYPRLVARMYDLLLWEKGLVGSSVAALRAQIADGGDSAVLQLFDELAARKRESIRLADARPDGWQDLQRETEAQANALEQQLVRRVSAFGERERLAHASWRDVREKLQPGAAAVEIVRFTFYPRKGWQGDLESRYAALVVTPRSERAPTLVP